LKRTLVVGEINADLILTGASLRPQPGKEVIAEDGSLTLGSASAICAAGLARLGNAVAFAGVAGADLFGDFCLRELTSVGVDVSRVRRAGDLRTGITVSLTTPGDRSLITLLGATCALRSEDVGDDVLLGFAHLHVSSYFLQSGLRPGCADLFARATRLGLTTSLDCGFDPSERWEADLRETLAHVDLFFPNEVELLALTGVSDPENALRVLENGRTRTIAKLGARGCLAREGASLLRVPAFAVGVVDPTGAGDSFDAGFLHGFLRRKRLHDCLRYAAACGALSTRALGGAAGQPTAAELQAFLEQQP
jgi:sugar/nucleoside kinase (ribokinase family)